MKEPLSAEERDAKVQADAAKISGGIETAVGTVAAVASLFVGSVRSTQQQSEQDSELQPPVSAAEQQTVLSEWRSEPGVVSWYDGGVRLPIASSVDAADDGLSVDEMMQMAREKLDDSGGGAAGEAGSDEALRAAFEALKQGDGGASAAPAESAKLKSSVLRGAASLAFELRSFLEGSKRDLERVQNSVVDKVKMDATLAARAADWVVRRAILDSGRVLGAAASSFATLGPATAAATATDDGEGGGGEAGRESAAVAKKQKAAAEAAPFASRLGRVYEMEEERRALGAASAPAVRGALPADATTAGRTTAAVVAAAEEERRAAAAALLNSSAEAVRGLGGKLEVLAPLEELQLPPRAVEAAGQLGVLLQRSQRDFESFDALARRGQLPTLAEELSDAVVPNLPNWVKGGVGAAPTALGSFASAADPAEQRRQRLQRRAFETEARRLRLAAALASRASKDSSDAVVFGVLPAAKATATVVARRAAEVDWATTIKDGAAGTASAAAGALAARGALPASLLPKAGSGSGGGGGGLTLRPGSSGLLGGDGMRGLLSEVTAELVKEYSESVRDGVRSGVLPDMQSKLGEATDGATRSMGDRVGELGQGLRAALPAGVGAALPGGAASTTGAGGGGGSGGGSGSGSGSYVGVVEPTVQPPKGAMGAMGGAMGAMGARLRGDPVAPAQSRPDAVVEPTVTVEAVEVTVEVTVEATVEAVAVDVEAEVEMQAMDVSVEAVEVEVLGADTTELRSAAADGDGRPTPPPPQRQPPPAQEPLGKAAQEDAEWLSTITGAWQAAGEEAQTTRTMEKQRQPPSQQWAGAEVGVGVGGEEANDFVEVEVEVEAVSEQDEQEAAREQLLEAVDMALYSGEAAIKRALRRSGALTPEAAREWELLKSFDAEVREKERKAEVMEGQLLETLEKAVSRR